jgi:hypothetical protein
MDLTLNLLLELLGLMALGVWNFSKIKNMQEILLIEIREIKQDIMRLEKKQEQYNKLQERTIITERDLKAAFRRIDELREGGK